MSAFVNPVRLEIRRVTKDGTEVGGMVTFDPADLTEEVFMRFARMLWEAYHRADTEGRFQ